MSRRLLEACATVTSSKHGLLGILTVSLQRHLLFHPSPSLSERERHRRFTSTRILHYVTYSMPKRKAGADGAVDPPTKRSKTINNAVPATRQMRSTASGGTTYSVENAKPIRKSSRTTRPQRQTGANALTERTNEFVASSSERRSAADESGSEDELQVLSVSKSAVRGRGKAKAKDTAEHSPDELARAEPALAKRGRTRKTVASGPAPKPAVTRGRRRKETAIQKEVAEQDELGESIVLAVPTTPKKRGRPAKASVVDTGREVTRASPRKNTTAATALSIPKRALGRPKQIAVTESTPIESPTNNRSASRSAKAPARDEWEPEDSDSDPPQLLRQLGAETPTRRGRGRIPASASAKVVHDVEPSTPSRRGKAIQPRTLSPPKIREDLLFSTRKKTQAKPRKTVQIQESDDELVVDSAPKLPSLQDLAKKQASRVSRPLPRLPGSDAEKGDMVHTLKSHVLQKLCGKPTTTKRENLMGLDDEYARVHHLLEQTVAAGEGNSMLLIGSRGVGKSLLVDTAINDLQETYKGDFLVVRLNGFFQTDDKLASREIWRQLGVEMDSEEGTGIDGIQPKTSNFGDTLSSILAVLSHPSEHAGEDDGGLTENKTAVSVIFVLEEFDLFVTHPRQALLYNLFDIAQARKAPIAVLGLTSRIDVVESLEKRVKSRFSHRTVHIKLPNSLERYWETCRRGLEVDVEQLEAEAQREKNEIEYFEKWNEELEVRISSVYEPADSTDVHPGIVRGRSHLPQLCTKTLC